MKAEIHPYERCAKTNPCPYTWSMAGEGLGLSYMAHLPCSPVWRCLWVCAYSGLRKALQIQKRYKIFQWETSIRALTMLGMGKVQGKRKYITGVNRKLSMSSCGNQCGHVSQYLFLSATPIYQQPLETSQVCFLYSSFISMHLKINSFALATSVRALSLQEG